MTVGTRDAIREVALDLFTQHGYDRTSLREIADRVGMTKASLYYHYPSKQALLLAIIEPLLVQWRAVVDRIETLPHSPANARRVLGEVLDVMLRNQEIARLFERDASGVIQVLGPVFEDLIELTRRLHRWLAGPSPSTADRIRAVAATEALSSALGLSPYIADAADDEVRATLLDSAAAVLRLPPGQPGT